MPAMDFPFPATVGDKYPVPGIPNQPVYTFDGVKWTTHGEIVDDIIGASDLIPLSDGVASAGTENNWSRGDHVHPALINDLVLTGNPTAPTPPLGDNDTTIATTAFVQSTVTATEIGTSVLVGSNAPVGAADNSLWFEDDSGQLYIFYNDGTGPSQWVSAAPVPDAITSRYGIYAAPFDAMAYSGMQINGGMDVSQELGATGIGASGYVCDGWRFSKVGTMVAGSASNGGTVVNGLLNSIYISVSTAQAVLGASDITGIYQPIEGYRIARLAWGTINAMPVTIAFWSRHHVAGTYSVLIKNSTAPLYSYGATYTHAVADVSQYNAITIPGATVGPWHPDNRIGMYVIFALAAGSATIAPTANTWVNGDFSASPGQINGVATTAGNAFAITGLVVLPGTQYPEAAQSALVMRPYDQELVTCRRYWQSFTPEGAGNGNDSANVYFSIRHPGMRAPPTLSLTGLVKVSPGTTDYTQSTAFSAILSNNSENGVYRFGDFVGLTATQGYVFRAGGQPKFDARL